jgi:hypothetical protein
MKVNAEILTGWPHVLRAARATVPMAKRDDKWNYRSLLNGCLHISCHVSDKFKHDILHSGHSPLRAYTIWLELIDIPSFVSTHLVRHSVGITHFVASNRSDRSGAEGTEVNRLTPINHAMVLNAQSLLAISRKRLCGAASYETIGVWLQVEKEIRSLDPILADYMVPECLYRGGICHEPKEAACGAYKHYSDTTSEAI